MNFHIAMEKLRVYRPRVVLHGALGMGQTFVAAAVLHHLEGYHVQTLDLGSLLGDSARVCDSLFRSSAQLTLYRPWKQALSNSLLKPSVTNLP